MPQLADVLPPAAAAGEPAAYDVAGAHADPHGIQQPWPAPPISGQYAGAGGFSQQVGYYNPNLNYGTPVIYVGFWWRVLAYIIDAIILFIPNKALELAMGEVIKGNPIIRRNQISWIAVSAVGTYFVLTTVISWLYFALMETSTKQATLGKQAIGAKVTDMHGQRIGFGQATGDISAKSSPESSCTSGSS